MDRDTMRILYDKIENPWEFIVKASKEYKEEFRKTSKIGNPPKLEDIMIKVLAGEMAAENEKNQPDKGNGKKKEKKESDKKKK
ncbi:MAG: hypothetical protein JXJ19_05980 [Elusimicrobia bacterium]|nr:hypothetical protein [Elusimicrobiota bacterium]